jgi:membrane-associated phospholipid phosphatase
MKSWPLIIILVSRAFGQSTETAIEVSPGPPVIKNKDLWEKSGWVHPFRRMPGYVLADQKAAWTSPVHTARSDLKWWVIFGGTTAALVATDRWTVKQFPNSSTQLTVSKWGSRFGSAYSLIPVSAGFYFIGTGTHNERFRETGLIAFEALIDANIMVEVVKLATGRARPTEDNGRGRFWSQPGSLGSSFPSGHATNAWALASVIAHEYPRPLVKIIAYGLASTVVIARVGARRHFPGDVVAGAGIGWFLGDYIYGRRHNRELDRKPTVARRILDRVRISGEIQ